MEDSMKNKGFLAVLVLLVLVLALGLCGCGKKADEPAPAAKSSSGAATPQYTVREVTSIPNAASAPAAVEAAQPEAAALEPTVEEAMTKATEDAMAESLTVNTDAPIYFMEEFDGEINLVDWESTYSFWVDEDVEEGDEEATPQFEFDQRRGVLRFDLYSPDLALYHTYTPHTYQDVRVDMEVENKGTTVNNVTLYCRFTDYGWYEFIADSGGYYSIIRYYEDGSKELASGGIRSMKFGAEKENVYTAICKGKTLTYLVNDVEIARVKDEEIPDPGYIGFSIVSGQVLPVSVEINWLAVTDPN
jgi:hypothetical protein